MLSLARAAQHFNAQAANNGLDWLSRQRQLYKADSTPFAVVHDSDMFRVRHYPAPRHAHADCAPLVLVPPPVVAPSICDLLPQRSLVRFLCARGFNVYLVDWTRPDRRHDSLGLQAYALELLPRALHAVRDHAGQQRLSLVGYCMGGLFALLHAGSGRDRALSNIVTIATPVDLHAATFAAAVPRTLQKPMRLWRQASQRRLRDIDPSLLHVPGRINALAFKLSSPLNGAEALWKLSHHFDNHDAVAAHSTMQAWLGDLRAWPGALLRDLAVRLWLDNELAHGPMRLGDVWTDLARIDCPVLAIAGQSDTLVGQASTRRLLERVASRDTTHVIVPGGHVGLLAGAQAPAYCWPRLADWLALRAPQASGNAVSATPAAASRRAVSCNGKPMTPE